MKFAHTKRLMLVAALALFNITSYSMEPENPSSNSNSNKFSEVTAGVRQLLTDAYGEPVGAILCYLGIPVAIKLGELSIQGVVHSLPKQKMW